MFEGVLGETQAEHDEANGFPSLFGFWYASMCSVCTETHTVLRLPAHPPATIYLSASPIHLAIPRSSY
jgi:hypothetical protein